MNIRLYFQREKFSDWRWVDYRDYQVDAYAAYESALRSMEEGKVHTVKLVLQDGEEQIEIFPG